MYKLVDDKLAQNRKIQKLDSEARQRAKAHRLKKLDKGQKVQTQKLDKGQKATSTRWKPITKSLGQQGNIPEQMAKKSIWSIKIQLWTDLTCASVLISSLYYSRMMYEDDDWNENVYY